MDDRPICCFSNDWDSHIEQLELTLRILEDGQSLTVKPCTHGQCAVFANL